MTALEEQKKSAINTVNSKMDELIQLIQFQRKNMIDEINATMIEKSKQLNQQKSKATELEEQYMIIKNQLDNNDRESLSIKQFINGSITQYQQYEQLFDNIQCTITPIIDIDNLGQRIKEYCCLKIDDGSASLSTFDIDPDPEHEIKYNNINDNINKSQSVSPSPMVNINNSNSGGVSLCKFSDKYRGQYGLITLQDNNQKLKKAYKKVQQYTWIALDIDPIKSGVHCFRVKVLHIDYIFIH